MSPEWAVVAAALGGSFLTGATSFGLIWVQEKLRGRASDRAALRAAIQELLSRSIAVAMRGQAMGQTMRVRSGVGEGLDVAMHHRKPLDPLEFHDWLAQDAIPLNAALNEIWTRWDQEGIRLANDVVGKCMDLVAASTAAQPTRSARERVRRWVMGERWTDEMIAENERVLTELAHARKRLADHARAKLGLPATDLFAQVESPTDEDAASNAPTAESKPELGWQNDRTALPSAGPSRLEESG